MIFKKCANLLGQLMRRKGSEWFNEPVDVVKLNIPDYFTIIKHPMDFGTIKKKLTLSQYLTPRDFLADMRLTFSNAMAYNPAGNVVHTLACDLGKYFEARWKPIRKRINENVAKSAEENPSLLEEFEMPKTVSSSEKSKISPLHQKAMSEPLNISMTHEEKTKLMRDLEASQEELPDNIIQFLNEETAGKSDVVDEAIEIDPLDLCDDSLYKLRKLLDDFLQTKQGGNSKTEHCEIELQNVSGFSNSSMQIDKGNEPGEEEEIDICGNEFPVSICPTVKIEWNEINDCVNAAGESTSNSEFVRGPYNHENVSQPKSNSFDSNSSDSESSRDSEGQEDGESTRNGIKVSPKRLHKAVLLNKFADTILKAREATLGQGEKIDPEKLQREREKEKARLQAEAKAALEIQKQAEEEAAAEAKRKRELDREAARQALLKMKKTVEINDNSRFLEDLEMLVQAILSNC